MHHFIFIHFVFNDSITVQNVTEIMIEVVKDLIGTATEIGIMEVHVTVAGVTDFEIGTVVAVTEIESVKETVTDTKAMVEKIDVILTVVTMMIDEVVTDGMIGTEGTIVGVVEAGVEIEGVMMETDVVNQGALVNHLHQLSMILFLFLHAFSHGMIVSR